MKYIFKIAVSFNFILVQEGTGSTGSTIRFIDENVTKMQKLLKIFHTIIKGSWKCRVSKFSKVLASVDSSHPYNSTRAFFIILYDL